MSFTVNLYGQIHCWQKLYCITILGNLYIASPSQTRAAARFTRKLRFIDDFNSFSSGQFDAISFELFFME